MYSSKLEKNSLVTKVYRKRTDVGRVLNAASECPERYKRSTIRALIQRALKTCSSENDLNTELRNCKRILVNNGFANRTIDSEIAKLRMYQNRLHNEPETDSNVTTIYNENQMTSGYKADERILHSIVHNNIVNVTNNKIKLLIF